MQTDFPHLFLGTEMFIYEVNFTQLLKIKSYYKFRPINLNQLILANKL